jgi:hypothetical protein
MLQANPRRLAARCAQFRRECASAKPLGIIIDGQAGGAVEPRTITGRTRSGTGQHTTTIRLSKLHFVSIGIAPASRILWRGGGATAIVTSFGSVRATRSKYCRRTTSVQDRRTVVRDLEIGRPINSEECLESTRKRRQKHGSPRRGQRGLTGRPRGTGRPPWGGGVYFSDSGGVNSGSRRAAEWRRPETRTRSVWHRTCCSRRFDFCELD